MRSKTTHAVGQDVMRAELNEWHKVSAFGTACKVFLLRAMSLETRCYFWDEIGYFYSDPIDQRAAFKTHLRVLFARARQDQFER